MKTLVLNSTLSTSKYFKQKKVSMEFYYGKLPGVFPLVQTTSHLNADNVMVDFYTPDIMDAVRSMIVPGQYDQVIFCFNPADYDSRLANTGGSTYGPDVYLGTQLCIVRLDGHEELYAQHEAMHMITHKLQRLGYPVNDEMDMTNVNGIATPYYHNEDPFFPDGNYERTWKNIQPYISHLEDKCPVLKQSTTKNPWAFCLQLQLLALGYDVGGADGYFGSKTLAVIRSIQKNNGLVVDGIVGPKTLAVLAQKKSMNSPNTNTDIKSWGLVSALESKAVTFLSLAKQKGYDLKITQGFRDPAYQDKLYAQGRTLPGNIVTDATGKTSKHCLGMAFDFAFNGSIPYPANTDWKAIGAIGKSIGLKWGGDWKSFTDLLHFEI